MKRKFVTLLITVLGMLVFAAPAFAQGPINGGRFVVGENFTLESGETVDGDMIVFGGSVNTEAGSTIEGSLVVFGGSVVIDGAVDGDIGVIGGSVTINGQVDGDIGAVGGNANIGQAAVVNGDIGTFGGRVDVAEGAQVRGQFKGIDDFDDDHFHRAVPPAAPAAPSPPRGEFSSGSHDSGFSSIFGWIGRIVADIVWTISLLTVLGLISWLVAAFLPEQMIAVRRTVSDSTALSFGVGLVTMVVAGVVGAVLLITICLAFIPILGYMVLAVAALFGWIVIGQMIGERLLESSGRPGSSFIFSSIVGVVVLTLLTNMPVIGEIPCLGWLLAFVGFIVGVIVSLTGLGAVLLTRFGTRPYPVQSYGFSGGPSPSRGSRGGSGGFGGDRVRWTDPEPDVSDDDAASSEEELRAKIKAALAEADEIQEAKAKAKKVTDETPQSESPADEPPQDDDAPEPDQPDGEPKRDA